MLSYRAYNRGFTRVKQLILLKMRIRAFFLLEHGEDAETATPTRQGKIPYLFTLTETVYFINCLVSKYLLFKEMLIFSRPVLITIFK